MAEEPEVKEEPKEEPQPEPEPEPEPEPSKPPPGFVPIRALQDERNKRQGLEEQFETLQREMGALKERDQKGQEPQKVTIDQVLQAYSQGQITEQEKDRWLFKLAKEEAKQEGFQELRDFESKERAKTTAGQEIQKYLNEFDQLKDRNSREYGEVAREYQNMIRMGLPEAEGTQAAALKAVMGPVERRQNRRNAEEVSRHGTPFAEVGSGQGAGHTPKADPLKRVPKTYLDYWNRQGYTQEEQEKLAARIPEKKLLTK